MLCYYLNGKEIQKSGDMSFPGGQMVKILPAMQVGPDLIPGSGRSPGEGNGYPL